MSLRDRDLATESSCKQMVPAWVQSMREAAMKLIKKEDVEQIVRHQIDAAKKGDRNAVRFVFDQILGGAAMRGATFVQNNYGAEFGDQNARPTPALPGTSDKLDVMRRRVANGQSLSQPGDASIPAWECASCGHTTRIKPERCTKCGKYAFEAVGTSKAKA